MSKELKMLERAAELLEKANELIDDMQLFGEIQDEVISIRDYLDSQNIISLGYTDESIMYFGKYNGKKLGDIPACYLIWLYEELDDLSTRHPLLYHYIKSSLTVLYDACEAEREQTWRYE